MGQEEEEEEECFHLHQTQMLGAQTKEEEEEGTVGFQMSTD